MRYHPAMSDGDIARGIAIESGVITSSPVQE
jgi:hypothetical protein